MIISHKYKFIFIKTAKTAGTSLEVFLSSVCSSDDILTPIYPQVAPHFPRNHEGYYNHMPACEIRDSIGRNIWNDYFKFCVERNPWDKTVSYFHMAKARYGEKLTMDEYLESGELPINYPLYTDIDNPKKIIVDRVLYYETLLSDLEEIFSDLGITFSGSLGVRAKSEYRTDRRPYQDILTENQAELIRKACLPEIEMHGYRYDQDYATIQR